MTTPTPNANLQAGIEAVKQGKLDAAQELLLQVIEADDQNEQAWLWLSYAVTGIEDKIVALENALTINPHNRTAQQNLDRLRAQADKGTPPPTAATTTPNAPSASAATAADDFMSKYAVQSRTEAMSPIDNPFQCVYCGAPAKEEDRKCPECGKGLYVKRSLSDKMSFVLQSAIFASTVQAALTICETIFLASMIFQGKNPIVRYIVESLGLTYYIGDYLKWTALEGQILLVIGIVRSLAFLMVVPGLAGRFVPAYYANIFILIADLVWNIVRWVMKYIGPIAAVIDMVVHLIALTLIFSSDREFAVNDERMLWAPEKKLRGGVEFNRKARLARAEGKWALAVAYWRGAVAAMPRQPEYYKNLAVGYAQIGYYERALLAITEAGRQDPTDPDIERLTNLIANKQKSDPKPRG